jgi:hypothetical protein
VAGSVLIKWWIVSQLNLSYTLQIALSFGKGSAMTPYTLPINHSETQVLELIKRAQAIQRPLMLTVDDDPEPVVVILKKDAYEQTERQRYHLYHLRLTQLQDWLDRAEAHMDDPAIRQKCIAIWQKSLSLLWEVTPGSVREFCANLMLSVKQLDPEQFSPAQIAALRYSLELLRDSDPEESAIEKAYHLLITSDLPPILSFSDSVIQSYIDEL